MDVISSPSLSTSSTLTSHSRSTSYSSLGMSVSSLRRPSTPNSIQENNTSDSNNGFDQVLREMRSGLKRGDSSWRVKQLKKRNINEDSSGLINHTTTKENDNKENHETTTKDTSNVIDTLNPFISVN
ncbi:hypothetical protein BJ944DRAFT_30282 [Cunninghamella echinulata]|nr:hypothetical protein BJ944DRAFT_30282 [Cunninghamella echinulata]